MDISQLAELGSTVVIVAIFVWYLRDKNGKQETAMKEIAKTLVTVNESQQVHTRVLIRVAENHELMEEADALIKGEPVN